MSNYKSDDNVGIVYTAEEQQQQDCWKQDVLVFFFFSEASTIIEQSHKYKEYYLWSTGWADKQYLQCLVKTM